MSTPVRRHPASSPFRNEPEPIIEEYAVGDPVCHDAHGVGKVVGVEASAVAVDFRGTVLRVPSPYRKMEKL